MRLAVRHHTIYRFDAPAEYAAQVLRLTPRQHQAMQVVDWKVTAGGAGQLARFEDGFGNLCHLHTVVGSHVELSVEVDGIVETSDSGGVVRGAIETMRIETWLRATALTRPSEQVEELAASAATEGSTHRILCRLMELVADRVAYRSGSTSVLTTAAEALAGGSGVCQDQAHVFLSAARLLGIPSRYVGGYLCLEGASPGSPLSGNREEAGHAWAEAYDKERGWTGYDPANRSLASALHVRTSIGLDYESAAPVRGVRRGSGREALSVDVKVARLGEQ